MNLLHLKNFPIFKQLQIEEALLRLDEEEWCIINEGSPPAIVMGISGKPIDLIHIKQAKAKNIPIIKRYSGGGTVIVDENTLFVSFICKAALHCPKAIMKWAANLYQPVIKNPKFALQEHDFAIGEKKFGGNAQYLRKNRFVHHTTFLWDYTLENMALLKMPKKTPAYRADRSHEDFVCCLKNYLESKDQFTTRLKSTLKETHDLKEVSLESTTPLVNLEHRKTTQIIEI